MGGITSFIRNLAQTELDCAYLVVTVKMLFTILVLRTFPEVREATRTAHLPCTFAAISTT